MSEKGANLQKEGGVCGVEIEIIKRVVKTGIALLTKIATNYLRIKLMRNLHLKM